MERQFEKAIGVSINYKMLSCNPWRQNLMLADRYQDRRVFLAGDAVHLVIPTGGLGMNSGVGDAIDLGWKLEATLKGFGGPKLLDRMSMSAGRSATATWAPRVTQASADASGARCGAGHP